MPLQAFCPWGTAMTEKAPKSMRLQIGIFGRTNVGKSSFLNYVTGQDVAIISAEPGTTTDVVEKTMELLPVGPVVFLDTGGLDDDSVLAQARIRRTRRIFDRCDVALLVGEAGIWTDFEEEVVRQAAGRNIPVVAVVNKADLGVPSEDFLSSLRQKAAAVLICSSIDAQGRDRTVGELKRALVEAVPEDFFKSPPLAGDLIPSGGLAVLIVPIDLEAPKGRLILPQVQTIRDALDHDAAVLVVKEREYAHFLTRLNQPPDLVISDSQVVMKMTADTPLSVKCTTFSILFSRHKGELISMVEGVFAVDLLKDGDKVLIGEACSHHALEDDIGRVKIPRWLRQYTGKELEIRTASGRDYPEDLHEYRLVIHCGSCMLTRKEMLFRISAARAAGVPITNYGVCISYLQGVLERVLSPFPYALETYRRLKTLTREERLNADSHVSS